MAYFRVDRCIVTLFMYFSIGTTYASINNTTAPVNQTINSVNQTLINLNQTRVKVNQTYTNVNQTSTNVNQTKAFINETFSAVNHTEIEEFSGSASGSGGDSIADEISMYPKLLTIDTREIMRELNSNRTDNESMHSFVGKFLIMPEEDANVFESEPLDGEHGTRMGDAKVQITYADDGTKIVQHDPTEIPPSRATPTPPPPPASPIPMKEPEANSTEVKYMKNGTRITQLNTGIKEDGGSKEPKWIYEVEDWDHETDDVDFHDTNETNAAGYKNRHRPAEEVKKKKPTPAVDSNTTNANADFIGLSSRPMFKSWHNKQQRHQIRNANDINTHQQRSYQSNTKDWDGSPKVTAQLDNISKKLRKINQTVTGLSVGQRKVKHHYSKVHNAADRENLYPLPGDKPTTNNTNAYNLTQILDLNGTDSNHSTAKDLNSDAQQTNGTTLWSKALMTRLRKVRFLSEPGVVEKGQDFAYISQCGLYTEPQNVSSVQHAWVTKAFSPYFYLYEKPKHYEQCKVSAWMNGTDMRGNVFISFEVKSIRGSNMENNAKICEKYCCKEPRCAAWVLRQQSDPTANCPRDSFCCWLKTAVPKLEPHENCISGVVHREHYRHPPTGMRSAVPLGGLAAGSFELRADGTFHEWTIENQSPAGSAKLGKTALDLALFGIRIKPKGGVAKSAVVRTHAPSGLTGVSKIAYSGSYPVSKYEIELTKEEKYNLTMYAYSSFHPRQPELAATPATAFSLEVTNPTDTDIEVSFMFSLPFGYNDDTIRKGNNFAEVAFTKVVKAEDCQKACVNRPSCMSWTTNGPFSCMLKDGMPLHAYEYGIISGLKGEWTSNDSSLSCSRPGFYPQSGDITLRPIKEEDSDVVSSTVTNSFDDVWLNFEKTGNVGNRSDVNVTGLHGAVSVKAKIKPGKSKLLNLIFGWYFPNRDLTDERVGNFYSNLFASSAEAVDQLERDLIYTVDDVVRWQSSIVSPTITNNTAVKNKSLEQSCNIQQSGVNQLPECLQDVLLNSLSFWRSAMWMENGRWRQWEAYDCANLDPVHVDFHRIVPYIIFYPDLVKRVMRGWAGHQLSDGMIQESLSMGCLEETYKEGNAGGRSMADANVAFIVQVYLVYSWTNDTEFFTELYPFAIRAFEWLTKDGTHGTGLPYRKPDIYDLFDLDRYDHCAYNSVMMLLALKTTVSMATAVGDDAMAKRANEHLRRAELLFDIEMWDEKNGFYHAWFDAEWGSAPWLMADTFYGQIWAHTLGLGDLISKDKLKSHLLKERERNDSPYGLKVMSKGDKQMATPEDTSLILGDEPGGCKSLENVTRFESIWMSASTDWSTLQLYLGTQPKLALHQAEKSLDHYRSTLKDQWNFHGLTSSDHYGLDGLPWATSHYTFQLVLWHLPLALSGQQYYAPNGSLTFEPKFDIPYRLPFYTPGAMGTIEANHGSSSSRSVQYKLTVTSGRLDLNYLSISHIKYGNGPISIEEDKSITWSAPVVKKSDVEYFLDQLKN